MKYFFILLIGITVISCESHIKTELLALKFDENVLSIVQTDKQLKKGQAPIVFIRKLNHLFICNVCLRK
jgi:hypothetical protein